jgi:hypothetical protein
MATTGPDKKGWEFWLGGFFVAAAVLIIAPAFWFDAWRERIEGLGPAIAAFAVVGASLIAYDGAIAKVRFDRSQAAAAEKLRRQRALLRLGVDAIELYKSAAEFGARLESGGSKAVFSPLLFRFAEPQSLANAWDTPDAWSPEIVHELILVRMNLKAIERLLNAWEADGPSEEPLSEQTDVLAGYYKAVQNSAQLIAEYLDLRDRVLPGIDAEARETRLQTLVAQRDA